jgi:hypothetical protein
MVVPASSRPEQGYLDRLKAQCYSVDAEGHTLEQALALEDVFVPVRIVDSHDFKPAQIWDFLPPPTRSLRQHLQRRIVVLAGPGYGKTTLLRHLTFTFAAQTPYAARSLNFFPILIRLREVHRLVQGMPGEQPLGMRSLKPLMDSKRQRLEAEKKSVEQILDINTQKLGFLRQARAVEAAAEKQFQLDQQIESTTNEIAVLNRRLSEIEAELNQQPERIVQPFFESGAPLRLPDLIANYWAAKGEFRDLGLSRDWVEDKLRTGDCLVLLDGFDEVPKAQRSQVRRWVDEEMRAYVQTLFILTSRPKGFETQLDNADAPLEVDLMLKVQDFTDDQKEEFIQKWYGTIIMQKWRRRQQNSRWNSAEAPLTDDAIRANAEAEAAEAVEHLRRQLFASLPLRDLAKNPLLITMIAEIHRGGADLPKQRLELYRKIFDVLLGIRPRRRGTVLSLSPEQNLAILQLLSLRLVEQDSYKDLFELSEATPWILDCLMGCAKDKPITPQQFWEEMRDVAGVLCEKEQSLYEFAHLTFQDYLAARQIREEKREALLVQNLTNDRWEEIICFYAAMGNATSILNAVLSALEQQPTEALLKLARRIKHEGRQIDSLDRYNSVVNRQAIANSTLSAELQLEQKLTQLSPLSKTTAIEQSPITTAEYQLFLQAQQTGQFHSQANAIEISPSSTPVRGISGQDANWFCAWLATQPALQSKQSVYWYRLPTEAEVRTLNLARSVWTSDQNRSADMLLVVRETLPARYRDLLSYVAGGRWQDANRETNRLMLAIAGQTKRGYLIPDDIQKFPCQDLRILDQLWVKFSGGLFGFSVQKQIYVETGNLLDGEYHKQSWHKFCDVTQWAKDGAYVDYPDEVTFDLSAPSGHLPLVGWSGFRVESLGGFIGGSGLGGGLFSHAETCEL